jgi:hypothetical protein
VTEYVNGEGHSRMTVHPSRDFQMAGIAVVAAAVILSLACPAWGPGASDFEVPLANGYWLARTDSNSVALSGGKDGYVLVARRSMSMRSRERSLSDTSSVTIIHVTSRLLLATAS